MGVLAEVGWITLDDGSIAHRCAAGAISVIALMSGLIFYAYTYRKWGPFLSNAKLDLHSFQEGVRNHPAGDGDGAWRRSGGGTGTRTAARRQERTPQERDATLRTVGLLGVRYGAGRGLAKRFD